MPRHEKEEAKPSSESYQVQQDIIASLLDKQKQILGGNIFAKLDEDKQLEYSQNKKILMESYWNSFEIARDEGNFDEAVKDFAKALEMGFEKANKLFKHQSPTKIAADNKISFSKKRTKNLYTGLRYRLGLGLAQNDKEAFRFIEDAAQKKRVFAQIILGIYYENGFGVAKDKKEGFEWFRLAAEQGHARAQCNLGYGYEIGINVAKDEKEAVKWYRLAAEQGYARAQCCMGVCYDNGIGVTKDEKEAVKWYRLASEQGDARAQCYLGVCYEYGTGVTKDEKEAVKWYRLAAEQGYASAQCCLGVCYDNGIGVTKKDEKEAVKWYRLAAEQRNAGAQFNLGLCYLYGTGVAKDEKEAVKWVQLAAEQGDARAQCCLGACYEKGIDVAKEEKEAVKWYRLAAEQGDARALRKLKNFNNSLADYTVALLEEEHDKLIALALSDKELSAAFFEKDIFCVIKQLEHKDRTSLFLQTLAENIKGLDKNQNASRTTLLLSVDKAIRTGLIESNEENAALMTGLLENFEPGDAERGHIKNLMHFFCNIDNEENAKEALETLCKLWYRAQSFNDFQMDDSGLNQLIATRIVSQLFDKRYVLAFTKDFSEDKLKTLFYAYETTPSFTVEELNKRLGETLLMESKDLPKNVLPALKTYLSNDDNFNGERPYYIEKLNGALQSVNPGNENEWQSLFDDLKEYASGILLKQKRPSLFSNKTLCDEERTLLQALSKSDTVAVSEWMKEHIASHQESASPSASLG